MIGPDLEFPRAMFRGVVARAFCGKSFGSFGKFSHLVPQLQLSDSIPISSFPVSSNNEKYGERGCSRPLDTRSLTIAKVKAYQKEGGIIFKRHTMSID